jgi:hypothetical protein
MRVPAVIHIPLPSRSISMREFVPGSLAYSRMLETVRASGLTKGGAKLLLSLRIVTGEDALEWEPRPPD